MSRHALCKAVLILSISTSAPLFSQSPQSIAELYYAKNYAAAEEAFTSLTQTSSSGGEQISSGELAEALKHASLSAFERNRHKPFRDYIDAHRPLLVELAVDEREDLLFKYAQSYMLEKNYEEARSAFASFGAAATNPENQRKAKYHELFAFYRIGENEFLRASRGNEANAAREDATLKNKSADLWREFSSAAELAIADGALAPDSDEAEDLQDKAWRAQIAAGEEHDLDAASQTWTAEKVARYDFSKASAYYTLKSDRRRLAREAFLAFLEKHPDAPQAGDARYFAARSLFDIAKAKLNASRTLFREKPDSLQARNLRADAMTLIQNCDDELAAIAQGATANLLAERRDDVQGMRWQVEAILTGAKEAGEISQLSEADRENYYYSQIWAHSLSASPSFRNDIRAAATEFLELYPDSRRAPAARLVLIRQKFDTGLDELWAMFHCRRRGDLQGEEAHRQLAVQAMEEFCREYEQFQANRLMPTEKRTQDDLQLKYWEALHLSGQESRLASQTGLDSEEQRIRLAYAESQALHHGFQTEEFQSLARLLLSDPNVPLVFKHDLTKDYMRSFSLEERYAELDDAAAWIISISPSGSNRWAVGKYFYGVAMAYQEEPQLESAREAFDAVLNSGLEDNYIADHIPTFTAFWRAYIAIQEQDRNKLSQMVELIRNQMPDGPVRDHALAELAGK